MGRGLVAPVTRSFSSAMLPCLGSQPQGDVGWLHRLPYHTHQVVVEGFQVRLVTQCGGEGFQGLGCIVFPPVEASVYEGLDASPQWGKQCRYKEGGYHDRQGGLLADAG